MSVKQSFMLLTYDNQSDSANTSSSSDFNKENRQPLRSIQDEPSNVLKGSFTFTPRFLPKNCDHCNKKHNQPKKSTSFRKWSKELMANDSSKTLKRKGVKRKISIRSRQYLIPLSDQLRHERGEIATGECTPLYNDSSPACSLLEPVCSATATTLTTDSIRNIVREEIRSHLWKLKKPDVRAKKTGSNYLTRERNKLYSSKESEQETRSCDLNFSSNLDFEIPSDPQTAEHDTYEDSEDKSVNPQLDAGQSENQSEIVDSDLPELVADNLFLPEEGPLISSQKSFRTILQLQIEIWQKLLQLKESTEMLEKIALTRQLDCAKNGFTCLENEMILTDRTSSNSRFNSSLKAVISQLDSDKGGDSYTSNDYVDAAISCYSKMNEIEHRLSDIEFRMASIHQILQAIRQQQYLELKFHQSNMTKSLKRRKHYFSGKSSKPETVGDGSLVNDTSLSKVIKDNGIKDLKESDPPTTIKSEVAIAVRKMNRYDESYYEWRQYHMNLLHYNKSDRTLSLNKRPMVNIMKPPIVKYLQHNEKRYIRAKKPFFIVTPSRTNSLWNS